MKEEADVLKVIDDQIGTAMDNIDEFMRTGGVDQKVINIAAVCHAANREWCEANGDFSQKDWAGAEQWQRDSAVKGVQFRLDNPDAGHDDSHNSWMKEKVDNGWVYGEVKDTEARTHPCIVPFNELPEFQQKKDALFCAIVDALK